MGGQLLIVREAIAAYVNVLFQNSTAQTDKNHEETLGTRNKNKIWGFLHMMYGCLHHLHHDVQTLLYNKHFILSIF
jgi:hypothetical protein